MSSLDQHVTRHAQSPVIDGVYTLCHVTHEPDDTPVKTAAVGERVNCPNCRVVINYCRTFGEMYRCTEQPE